MNRSNAETNQAHSERIVTSGSDTIDSVTAAGATLASASVAKGGGSFQHQPTNSTMMTPPPPSLQSPSSISFTRVDGKGLWRSWKRNFKNKLLALLDLIDNCLDAAIINTENDEAEERDNSWGKRSDFVGRIHIYPDDLQNQSILPNTITSSTIAAAASHAATAIAAIPSPTPSSGLCIINNSYRPIRPLYQVLEVYNSSKIHSGAHDIGENGVGLKQGCATLSDLSFVLVKNGSQGFVELGIIAESLQMPEGC